MTFAGTASVAECTAGAGYFHQSTVCGALAQQTLKDKQQCTAGLRPVKAQSRQAVSATKDKAAGSAAAQTLCVDSKDDTPCKAFLKPLQLAFQLGHQ